MAHVQVRLGPGNEAQVLVDGVDLTRSILASGFEIDVQAEPPVVRMTVRADRLDVDLPSATIETEVATPHRRLCDPEVTA